MFALDLKTKISSGTNPARSVVILMSCWISKRGRFWRQRTQWQSAARKVCVTTLWPALFSGPFQSQDSAHYAHMGNTMFSTVTMIHRHNSFHFFTVLDRRSEPFHDITNFLTCPYSHSVADCVSCTHIPISLRRTDVGGGTSGMLALRPPLWGNLNCTAICLHSAYMEAGRVVLAM